MAKTLRPHQHEAVEFLREEDNRFLADDMGLGKTGSSLSALRFDECAVVVCPASVKSVWADECAEFAGYRTPVYGTEEGFVDALRSLRPDQLLIVGYSNLPRPVVTVEAYKALKPFWKRKGAKKEAPTAQTTILGLPTGKIPIDLFGGASFHGPKATPKTNPDDFEDKKRKTISPYLKGPKASTVVIFDEFHMAKNFSSQRTEACVALANSVTRRWGLTGTPMLGHWMELWNLLSTLNLAFKVFGTFNYFMRVCDMSRKPFGGFHYGKNPDSHKIHDLLSKVMLRRMKEEVLHDLPEKSYQAHFLPMPPGIDSVFPDLNLPEMRIPHLAPARKALADYKYSLSTELIESFEAVNEPLILFSAHVGPAKRAGARKGWASLTGETSLKDRKTLVDAFQGGLLKGLACTIAAAGVGLTLTRAAHILRIDRDWTPAINKQAEDRAYRMGQMRGVVIHDMETDHPIDVHLRAINQMKTDRIEPVFG